MSISNNRNAGSTPPNSGTLLPPEIKKNRAGSRDYINQKTLLYKELCMSISNNRNAGSTPPNSGTINQKTKKLT